MPIQNNYLYVVPATVEEGSFCDRKSKIHYDNVSGTEARNQVAVSAEHSHIKPDVRDEPPNKGTPNGRYNTTILTTDELGSIYPARQSPGE